MSAFPRTFLSRSGKIGHRFASTNTKLQSVTLPYLRVLQQIAQDRLLKEDEEKSQWIRERSGEHELPRLWEAQRQKWDELQKAFSQMIWDVSFLEDKPLTKRRLFWQWSDSLLLQRLLGHSMKIYGKLHRAYVHPSSGLYSIIFQIKRSVAVFFSDIKYISEIIASENLHSKEDTSLLRQALHTCYPNPNNSGVPILLVFLKVSVSKFSEDEFEAFFQSLNNDTLLKEYQQLLGPFTAMEQHMRVIFRKTKDLVWDLSKTDTSGEALVQTQWGQSITIETNHIPELVQRSKMSFKIKALALNLQTETTILIRHSLEYTDLVVERLDRYQEILKNDPSKLPLIKAHLLFADKPVMRDPHFKSRVLKHIRETEDLLNRFKGVLHALLHFLAQFDNPSISARPLLYFLSNNQYWYPVSDEEDNRGHRENAMVDRKSLPQKPLQSKRISPTLDQKPLSSKPPPSKPIRSPSLHPDADCLVFRKYQQVGKRG